MRTGLDHERAGRGGRRRRAAPRAVRRVAIIAALALALPACSGLPFFPERPVGRVSADDVAFPNINNAPDRPSELKSASEQKAMEQELETLGADHVKTAQKKIETQDRRQ